MKDSNENYLDEHCDTKIQGMLSYSINKGYDYFHKLIEDTPILKNREMLSSYGHIRNGLVKLALREVFEYYGMGNYIEQINTSYYKNGYEFLRINLDSCFITVSKTRNNRSFPKSSKYMEKQRKKSNELSLFEDDNDKMVLPYFIVTYGGFDEKLEYINIGIPSSTDNKWMGIKSIKNIPLLISDKNVQKIIDEKIDLKLTKYGMEKLKENDLKNNNNKKDD